MTTARLSKDFSGTSQQAEIVTLRVGKLTGDGEGDNHTSKDGGGVIVKRVMEKSGR
jgi:hypothetical protein